MSTVNLFRLIKLSTMGLYIISQLASCNEKEKPQNIDNKTIDNRDNVLELKKTIELEGVTGRIDHMAIDEKNQILFIAAIGNNTVEVVDLQKGARSNTIREIDEPQGIVFVPENNAVCVSSGGAGTCYFYDANTFKLSNSIKLGDDADNLRYDGGSKLIFAGFGEGGIGVIDALKQTLITSVSFAGHPEAFQYDKNFNRIYVNVPSVTSVMTVDLKNNSLSGNWFISNAASNFPMEQDQNDHLLFVGCRKPSVMIVFNTEASNEITRFDIKGDVDDIFYDQNRKYLYLSCGEGYLQVFKQEGKDKYEVIQELNTSKGARTSLFVQTLSELYLAVPKNGKDEAAIRVYAISQ